MDDLANFRPIQRDSILRGSYVGNTYAVSTLTLPTLKLVVISQHSLSKQVQLSHLPSHYS